MVVGSNPHREYEIHTNTSTSLFLRVDQWSSGRAVECDCPESSRGASPRRFESSLLREPRMKIVPMRGDYRGLAGVPLNRKHWHGWWAVRQRRSPAKTVGAEVPGEFDSRTIR